MRTGKGMGRPGDSRSNRVNRLKDEVYRQMFKLEECRPAAAMGLLLALLRAWVAPEAESKGSDEWDWLKKISPICLEMIECSMQSLKTLPGCSAQ